MSAISNQQLIIVLLILIMVSAFFSGSEIGLISINRYRLRHLARTGHRSAKLVQNLLKRPDRILSVILIGNTFANILSASVATLLAVRHWGEPGAAISTIVLTFVLLVFAEVAPKTVAALHTQRVAFIVVWPLVALLWILYPLVWLINGIANIFLLTLGLRISHRKTIDHLSGEELRTVVNEASGRVPSEHKEMLLGILDLGTIVVEDIMVPRNEIVGVDISNDWNVVKQQLITSTHPQLLVYDSNINNIVGIIHIQRIMTLLAKDKLNKASLISATDAAYFVPESVPLNIQLFRFRENKCRMAVVVDEYGNVQGLVKIEDILKEIVGEFSSDIAAISQEIHPQSDGSYLVDGTITIRELNRHMKWNLPVDGPKTLSGLIIEHLEVIPNSGVGICIAGYPIEVIAVQDNLIKTARIYDAKPTSSDGDN